MKVSPGLVAKASAAGTAAVAATTSGIIFRDEISDFFYPDDFISLNERMKGLGLPEGCEFEEGENEKDCGKLSFEKLKSINFDGKNGENIEQTTNADKVTLKIKKAKNKNDFPGKIKIVFQNSEDVNAKKKTDDEDFFVDWKKNTNPEYKIEGGKLKKAWSATKLAQKIGFTTCDENETTEECTLGTYLNVFISSDSYILGGKVTKPNNDDLKMSYESESEGYNQGFKFKIENGLDGVEVKNWEKAITLGTGTFYEIKEQEIDGAKYWFLCKKDQ